MSYKVDIVVHSMSPIFKYNASTDCTTDKVSDLKSGTKKKDNRSLMCFVVIANPSNGQVKLLSATHICDLICYNRELSRSSTVTSTCVTSSVILENQAGPVPSLVHM